MPADEYISRAQVDRVFHGTEWPWKSNEPEGVDYDNPLHIATEPHDFPAEKAFGLGLGSGGPEEDWRLMNEGHIKEFAVDPAAKIHHTETPHMDAVLPEEEHERVKSEGFDMTMFKGGAGIVYNPAVLQHTRDISYQEHTRNKPEEEMEYMHGEDWRDWIR